MRWRRAFAALGLIAILSACDRDAPASPEARIRALIARAEAAAEAGEIDVFESALAADVQAGRGLGREDLLRRLRLYLLQHRRLHLHVRVESVEVPTEQLATASVLLGSAARSIDAPSVLTGYRASVHRISLELERRGGEWRVYRVGWVRVSPAELIRLM